ncbi:hypothetical protein [Proteus hauseri]|uniref:hypothetical protein n=1 Tax=Proteus hauseri TaxID=183417 RepID=UPI0032DA00C1
MKSRLLLTFSLCTLASFPLLANASVQCNEVDKDINFANNSIVTLEAFTGPIKSIVMTSTLPSDGRFKAIKSEITFDECGSLTKYHASLQEYTFGNIETNIIRMSESAPYDFKYKYQLKNRNYTHTFYVNEIFGKDANNLINKKTSTFYNAAGEPIGKDISQFTTKENRVVLEKVNITDAADTNQKTIHYEYDSQKRLLKSIEDNIVTLSFKYDENGKILRQIQSFKGFHDELKTYDFTCNEWDKYNNCLTWDLESTIKFDDRVVNYSKALIHNQFEYYQ